MGWKRAILSWNYNSRTKITITTVEIKEKLQNANPRYNSRKPSRKIPRINLKTCFHFFDVFAKFRLNLFGLSYYKISSDFSSTSWLRKTDAILWTISVWRRARYMSEIFRNGRRFWGGLRYESYPNWRRGSLCWHEKSIDMWHHICW